MVTQPGDRSSEIGAGGGASFYRLTHIDNHPLPVLLPVNGAEYLITEGSFQFEPPDADAHALAADGAINWDLRGPRSSAAKSDLVMTARHHYRRLRPDTIQFPFDRLDVPPEYSAQLIGDSLVLRVQSQRDREHSPAQLFGRDRTWRFQAAPTENPGPRWQVRSDPWPVGLHVTVGGREVGWLSRILGFILIPILRWRARRRP